jgi:hypothetical protein
VIAGPAEGFMADPSGRMIGMNSGRAVLELQDLTAALRAFPPAGKQTHLISVSIDPTAEGLAAMQKWLNEISGKVRPGDANAIVEGLKQRLGLQNVTVAHFARTHFAQVLVEADDEADRHGIEPPPVRMATFISKANQPRFRGTPSSGGISRRTTTASRNRGCDGDDWSARGKLVGAHELVAADGGRVGAPRAASERTLLQSVTDYIRKSRPATPLCPAPQLDRRVGTRLSFRSKTTTARPAGRPTCCSMKGSIRSSLRGRNRRDRLRRTLEGQSPDDPIGGGVHIEPTSACKPATS